MKPKVYISCKTCHYYFKSERLQMHKKSFECENCGRFPMVITEKKLFLKGHYEKTNSVSFN